MTRRLRVVHVTGCLDMGGQEKLLVEFAKHADRDRFDLRFVSLGTRGILAEEIAAHGWPVEALDIAPGLHMRLPWRLAKLLRRWEIDIVHTHNDRPLIYGAPAGRLARRRRRAHQARTQHRQLAAAKLADRARRPTYRPLRVRLRRLRRNWRAEQGAPATRLTTIHNGIDTRLFEFRTPCLNGPAVVVARLCADKDLATLLRAAALVIRNAPNFHLHVAGDGPEMTPLRELAAHLGITEHVRFLGLVRDVPGLLRTARLFVLSSISEGVPLTLLEAMASGLPCVATDVGGMPEVVNAGAGLLVPPRDPQALAAALLRVHGDDDLARRLGSAGRRHIETHFDVRRMVERYETLYARMGQFALDGTRCAKPQAAETEVQGCASHI